MIRVLLIAVFALGCGGTALAGQPCTESQTTAQGMQSALELASQVQRALDRHQVQAALVARVGSDVSKYGLRYTHAALVFRDPDSGTWTVLHKLNHCGKDTADLYSQGLANFFLDDPYEYRALLLVPKPGVQAQLLTQVARDRGLSVHQPKYSVLAYPFALDYQNSNGWLLEFLAAAESDGLALGRRAAQEHLRSRGYRPDRIDVGPLERVGASLFKANVAFLDHPLGERLSGSYSVVTVESMVRFLGDQGQVEQLDEISLPAVATVRPVAHLSP